MKGSIWTGLTVLLGSICLVLVVLAGINVMALGKTPEVQVNAGNPGKQQARLDERKPVRFSENAADVYTKAILDNPLFFADRTLPKPIVEKEPPKVKPKKREPEKPKTEELDATLVGIIMTPGERIAMVTDNKSQKTKVLRKGNALTGEQSAWKLDHIGARKVNFVAGSESTELALKVHTKSLQAPAIPAPPEESEEKINQPQPAPEAVDGAEDLRQSTEERLRQQIAERQEQLRAERLKKIENRNNNE